MMIRVSIFDEKSGNPLADNQNRRLNLLMSQGTEMIVHNDLVLFGKQSRKRKLRMKRLLAIATASDLLVAVQRTAERVIREHRGQA